MLLQYLKQPTSMLSNELWRHSSQSGLVQTWPQAIQALRQDQQTAAALGASVCWIHAAQKVDTMYNCLPVSLYSISCLPFSLYSNSCPSARAATTCRAALALSMPTRLTPAASAPLPAVSHSRRLVLVELLKLDRSESDTTSAVGSVGCKSWVSSF